MPSAPLWLCSPPWLRSLPPLLPAVSAHERLPSVWTPFLLHSSFPLVQVPSLFFCLCYFFFLLPYSSTWGVTCLLGGLTFSASVQCVFCRSSSTYRCVSTVSVGRKVISASYSSIIFSLSVGRFLITLSISVLVIGLFIFSISSSFSLGRLYIFKNMSISSRLSILLAYSCL